MFHPKQRRPMTQADIDKTISLQSSEIRKDFNARLAKNDEGLRSIIDSLMELKQNIFASNENRKIAKPLQSKTMPSFEEFISNQDSLIPKTAEVGTVATSKDIDITFYRSVNKHSSGDQVKRMIEEHIKPTKTKLIRQLQKDKNSQHCDPQVRDRISKQQINPKINAKEIILPHRSRIAQRQINSSNKSIFTANSTRRQKQSPKRIVVEQNKPKKVITKKQK